MRNIFYLPDDITIQAARRAWREQDASQHRGQALSYIDDEATLVRPLERSFKEIISKIDSPAVIVVWSIGMVKASAEELGAMLVRVRGMGVSLRLITPSVLLDPEAQGFDGLIQLLAAIEGGQHNHTQSRLRFLNPPLDPKVVEDLRADKTIGLSVRQIAKKHSVSVASVIKYTKDIVVIRREHGSLRAGEPEFDMSVLNDLQIERPSRLFAAVQEFIRAQRTFATRRNYVLDLGRFFDFVVLKFHQILNDPTGIMISHGLEYQESLGSEGLAPLTIDRYMRTIKTFLGYCQRRGYVPRNEIIEIKSPVRRRGDVKTQPAEPEEVKAILSHAIKRIERPQHDNLRMRSHRNFVALYLTAATGGRQGSIRTLQLKSVKKRHGKTLLEMNVKNVGLVLHEIDERAALILDKYIDTYYRGESPESYLIFSDPMDRSYPLTPQAMHHALKTILKELGLYDQPDRIKSHSFRSFFATTNYKGGVSLREIQIKLDHASHNQTAGYVKFASPRGDGSFIPELDGFQKFAT